MILLSFCWSNDFLIANNLTNIAKSRTSKQFQKKWKPDTYYTFSDFSN